MRVVVLLAPLLLIALAIAYYAGRQAATRRYVDLVDRQKHALHVIGLYAEEHRQFGDPLAPIVLDEIRKSTLEES